MKALMKDYTTKEDLKVKEISEEDYADKVNRGIDCIMNPLVK
jgi:hypothetical protein